jgi:uncharacterized membrane-anchored protein
MLLRILTSFFLIFGIILTLGFPWLAKARPHSGKVALEHYTLLFGTYLTISMICFVAAAICAVLMVRQVRESFREQTRKNLDELVESSLRQHQKPGVRDDV